MDQPLHLVPRPQYVERRTGHLALTGDTLICLPPDASDDDLFAARQLQAEILEASGLKVPIERQERPHRSEQTIVLLRDQRDQSLYPPGEFGWQPPQGPLPDQAYRLTVGPKGVVIAADSGSGLFYGVQTLRQLVRLHGARLPQLVISDQPALAERGVMLDVCRAKVPTLATLKELVEKLSFFKINQFQMHNEHAFYFPRHPRIGAGADRLTNEDILELDEHCRRHHVELVPNLQSFGHMPHILNMPEYRHLAETDLGWSLAPTVPEVYTFLDELYTDLLPAFSSRQFNVNSDETYDLGQGRSAARAAEVGPGHLYLEHMLRVRELVASHGRRMQMWDDIVLQHPDLVPELPDDVTLLDWHYEAEETYPSIALMGGLGRRFLVCPGTSSWNALFPRLDNSNGNIRTMAREAAEHGAVGLLNTDWGDHGHYQPLGNSLYGYAYGAEQAWSGGRTADSTFDPAFGLLTFGAEHGKGVVEAIRRLGAVNRLPGVPRPNASNAVYALFDEPLTGQMIEHLPHKTVDDMREIGRETAEVFASAAPGNREELALREMAFSARLVQEAAEKVALSQYIRAGWSQIAVGVTTGEAALQETGKWLRGLDERWEAMVRLRNEFQALWLERARPLGMAEAMGHYRRVLARYGLASDWLRRQRTALEGGQPVDRNLATYAGAGYSILWEKPFHRDPLQEV